MRQKLVKQLRKYIVDKYEDTSSPVIVNAETCLFYWTSINAHNMFNKNGGRRIVARLVSMGRLPKCALPLHHQGR